jgi:hypothetical protein
MATKKVEKPKAEKPKIEKNVPMPEPDNDILNLQTAVKHLEDTCIKQRDKITLLTSMVVSRRGVDKGFDYKSEKSSQCCGGGTLKT